MHATLTYKQFTNSSQITAGYCHFGLLASVSVSVCLSAQRMRGASRALNRSYARRQPRYGAQL